MKDIEKFIETNLNRKRLEDLSAGVISAYRTGDDFLLNSYAVILNEKNQDENRKKKFYRLIKLLHPDKLPVLRDDFEQAKKTGNSSLLNHMKQLLELKQTVQSSRAERFEYRHHETWADDSYDQDIGDFYEDSEVFEQDEEHSFISAVKNVIFGNHDFHPEPSDLSQIDGSLDLAFSGLVEIDGIEYCRNIRSLDLSGNSLANIRNLQNLGNLEELYASENMISDIEPLQELDRLEIIDLADNDIEEAEPLLKISGLRFVNLKNNPVGDSRVLEKLRENGVIVFF